MGRGIRSLLILVAALSLVLVSAPLASAVAPANDDFGSATVVGSLPFADALSTVDATFAADDPTGCIGAAHSVWYTYTAGLDGLVAFETYGSDFNTVLSAYTGTPGSLQRIACNNDAYSPQSHIKFAVTTGTTYYVMVAGYGYRTVRKGESGELVLNVHTEPPFTMELSSDGRGTLDPISGIATIGGTAVCSTPGVDLSPGGAAPPADRRHHRSRQRRRLRRRLWTRSRRMGGKGRSVDAAGLRPGAYAVGPRPVDRVLPRLRGGTGSGRPADDDPSALACDVASSPRITGRVRRPTGRARPR